MADIFISYRHGEIDKWVAGRLADRLTRSFDVFFDRRWESLDLGASFHEEIDDALLECRVVFAVIGPDWLSVKNLARLHSEGDWVRRELRTALRQRQIRVVPLFVQSDAPPDASQLPADLKALTEKHGFRLDPDRWEADYRDLERRVREWLSKRTTSVAMPPDLPFLCDRKDQEDAFVELVRGVAASSIGFMSCVVHGHKWESHDELLDRFRNHGVLDDVFDCVDQGAACHPVQLNRSRMKQGRFADALRGALKADVLDQRAIPDSELTAYFRRLERPMVVIVQLTWSDCRELGTSVAKNLAEAWQSLAPVGLDGIVERLPHPALLWINVTYEEPEYELPADALHSPLPKLCSVEEGHIREWVGLDRVKPFVSAKKGELLSLPSDARYCHTPGKLHMMRFADAVRDIIAAV